MYMAFVFPWLFSYILSEKQGRSIFIVLVVYALVMVYFSRSRIAYITILAELLCFFVILLGKASQRVRRSVIYIGIAVLVCSSSFMFISLDEPIQMVWNVITSLTISQQEGEFYLSNIARFGSQQTAFNIGLDHPILGVGLGQYGFYMPYYLPDYAYDSSEILIFASFLEDTPWAPAHGLYVRLIAEIGFIGLGLFLAIWISFLWSCWQTYRTLNKQGNRLGSLGIPLILSVLGVLMVGFTADTFRFFGYWFTLAIGWYYIEIPKILSNEARKSVQIDNGQIV
jgi:O-antigen ligase